MSTCEQLKQDLEAIKSLKTEFDQALEIDDFSSAENLKEQIERHKENLFDRISPNRIFFKRLDEIGMKRILDIVNENKSAGKKITSEKTFGDINSAIGELPFKIKLPTHKFSQNYKEFINTLSTDYLAQLKALISPRDFNKIKILQLLNSVFLNKAFQIQKQLTIDWDLHPLLKLNNFACHLNDGITVMKESGTNMGNKMKNGIIITDSSSDFAGINMTGGVIFIREKTGDHPGHYMEGGVFYARKMEMILPSRTTGGTLLYEQGKLMDDDREEIYRYDTDQKTYFKAGSHTEARLITNESELEQFKSVGKGLIRLKYISTRVKKINFETITKDMRGGILVLHDMHQYSGPNKIGTGMEDGMVILEKIKEMPLASGGLAMWAVSPYSDEEIEELKKIIDYDRKGGLIAVRKVDPKDPNKTILEPILPPST